LPAYPSVTEATGAGAAPAGQDQHNLRGQEQKQLHLEQHQEE